VVDRARCGSFPLDRTDQLLDLKTSKLNHELVVLLSYTLYPSAESSHLLFLCGESDRL